MHAGAVLRRTAVRESRPGDSTAEHHLKWATVARAARIASSRARRRHCACSVLSRSVRKAKLAQSSSARAADQEARADRAGRGAFLTNPSLSSLAAVERSQRPPRVESPAKECARPSVVTGGCGQSIGALDLAAVRSLTWASAGPYGNSCWGRGLLIRAAAKHGDSRCH